MKFRHKENTYLVYIFCLPNRRNFFQAQRLIFLVFLLALVDAVAYPLHPFRAQPSHGLLSSSDAYGY